MALYTLAFTVSAEGTTPAEPQPAGVFGDHQAARLSFTVPPEVPGECRFRLEIIDGSGGYDITELLEAENGVVSYAVPRAWTAAGTAAVRLIAVSENDSGEEVLCFHGAPAYLFFEEREDGSPLEATAGPVWQEVMHRAETVTNTLNHAMETGAFNGEKGEKGDKGDKGDMPEVDRVYNGYSENPQSGIALGPVIDDLTGAITYITGEIADARVDNFGNTHGSLGDSVRFMCHDLDSRKSNTDHVHEATEIRVDSHTPTLYGDSVQAALDYANQTLHEKADKQEVANALKGTARGSALTLNDVSPVEHTMGVKVRGKNLGRFLDGYDSTGESVTSTTLITRDGYYCALAKVSPGKSYTISKETNTSGRFRIFYYKNSPLDNPSEVSIGGLYNDSIVSYTVRNLPTDTNYLLVAIGNVLENIQIELGTTATEYTPYVPDLTAVKVSRCGKNIVNIPTIDSNSNGSIPCYITEPITISGINDNVVVKREDGTTADIWRIQVVFANGTTEEMLDSHFSSSRTFMGATKPSIDIPITAIKYRNTYLRSGKYKNIQVEYGKNATEYEPYICEDYTPTADGTVNGVTSLYPCTNLSTDMDGIVIDCEYNRDINKAFAELQQAIISLGGNV